jgi:hypothetical protein
MKIFNSVECREKWKSEKEGKWEGGGVEWTPGASWEATSNKCGALAQEGGESWFSDFF